MILNSDGSRGCIVEASNSDPAYASYKLKYVTSPSDASGLLYYQPELIDTPNRLGGYWESPYIIDGGSKSCAELWAMIISGTVPAPGTRFTVSSTTNPAGGTGRIDPKTSQIVSVGDYVYVGGSRFGYTYSTSHPETNNGDATDSAYYKNWKSICCYYYDYTVSGYSRSTVAMYAVGNSTTSNIRNCVLCSTGWIQGQMDTLFTAHDWTYANIGLITNYVNTDKIQGTSYKIWDKNMHRRSYSLSNFDINAGMAYGGTGGTAGMIYFDHQTVGSSSWVQVQHEFLVACKNCRPVGFFHVINDDSDSPVRLHILDYAVVPQCDDDTFFTIKDTGNIWRFGQDDYHVYYVANNTWQTFHGSQYMSGNGKVAPMLCFHNFTERFENFAGVVLAQYTNIKQV